MKILNIVEPRKVDHTEPPSLDLQPNQAKARMLYSGLSHSTEMNTLGRKFCHESRERESPWIVASPNHRPAVLALR